MQLLSSIITLILIGLLGGLIFTFGFVLFIWFMIVATILYLYVMIRQAWGGRNADVSSQIIEVEYRDISNDR